MVFTLAARIRPDGKELLGVAPPSGRFSRYVFAPASTTVWRRETLAAAGPWRDYRRLYRHPTQDLLLRAMRQGKIMLQVPRVTVVAIPAGLRRGSYLAAGAQENRHYLARMSEPDRLRRELLEEIALTYAGPLLHAPGWKLAGRAAVRLVRDALTAAGIDVWSLQAAVRYRRRGGLVDSRRAVKLQPPEAGDVTQSTQGGVDAT